MDGGASSITLPIAVVSPTDIARLLRELDSLDEYFRQMAIRTNGNPVEAPRYSRLLDEVVVANRLNLLQQTDREKLISALQQLAEYAPVLHISFSVDPPGPYVQKIVAWLRENIERTILVRVGLQPNIGAGCVVRTPNKSFDLSLRRFFDSKHEFFMKKLHEISITENENVGTPTTPIPAASTQPQPVVNTSSTAPTDVIAEIVGATR